MQPGDHSIDPDSFGRFLLPGPTEVRPDVLRALAEPVMGHRGPAIEGIMERIQFGLQTVFRTERPVYVSTSSGTGLMEAAIRNGVSRKVLCLVNGAFSQRFATIARACGREVDVLEVPWGHPHDPSALEERLSARRYDAVTVVHSETSTGVLQPLESLAWVVSGYEDTLFLVDSVTGVGGAPLYTDRWALDFVLTGSQKALALPPGLAFGVASPAMLERAATIPDRGMYFDLLRFQKSIEKFQTPNTPAVNLLYALDVQLSNIQEGGGLKERWARHRAMAAMCWSWVEHMREDKGVLVQILADPPYRSPTVSCIRLPDGVSGPWVVEQMRRRGFVIGTGYGKLKEETVRIGHMGDHTESDMDAALRGLEEVLRNT